ncbi:sensor histidine kinase [Micromonospora sp. KC207]|uniref:sensor histidine kinase n=1 Tax=Micromonospora sp. KC207 TaxID=2530377 RepID=UPI001404AA75|nr:ATP-binding protein [Micromonospora sp. KC207]
MPVRVDSRLTGRLPATVETTAYFVISEALTNVIKHANATHAIVRLHHARGVLRIEITDDGVGGAAIRPGSGLAGLADRVAALGGTLQVAAAPGSGTEVRAGLPAAEH